MFSQNSPAAESTTASSLSSMQDVWEQDADLAVCTTCGTQYSSVQGPPECVICHGGSNSQFIIPSQLGIELRRQYPCPTGQTYTSQRQLVSKTTFELVPEESDARILRIKLSPSLAIGQTPIVLLTPAGVVIWDCCGFASAELMQRIRSVSPTGQACSIVISHPHFFGASLSWAKMLNCNVFISKLDRQWYQRGLNCQDTHPDIAARRNFVIEVQEDLFRLPHLDALTLVRCGGHFPGSGVLHWDRDSGNPDGQVRKGAAVFCADTFMCLLDGQRFTFAYSFPNNIPLPPCDVEQIWVQMRKFNWTATFGGWSGRHVLTDSRSALLRSARYYIGKEGHSPDAFEALSEDAT